MTNDTGKEPSVFSSVDNYPVAIDTASQVISVRLTTPDGNKSQWIHLRRAQPSAVNHVIPANHQRSHFFVDGESFESSWLTLSYDAVGAISGIWKLASGHWSDCPLPEEYTGQVSLSPSVRFQFANLQDRDEFIRNFNKLVSDAAAAKPVAAKHVLAMIRTTGRSPAPYRIVSTLAEISQN